MDVAVVIFELQEFYNVVKYENKLKILRKMSHFLQNTPKNDTFSFFHKVRHKIQLSKVNILQYASDLLILLFYTSYKQVTNMYAWLIFVSFHDGSQWEFGSLIHIQSTYISLLNIH